MARSQRGQERIDVQERGVVRRSTACLSIFTNRVESRPRHARAASNEQTPRLRWPVPRPLARHRCRSRTFASQVVCARSSRRSLLAVQSGAVTRPSDYSRDMIPVSLVLTSQVHLMVSSRAGTGDSLVCPDVEEFAQVVSPAEVVRVQILASPALGYLAIVAWQVPCSQLTRISRARTGIHDVLLSLASTLVCARTTRRSCQMTVVSVGKQLYVAAEQSASPG